MYLITLKITPDKSVKNYSEFVFFDELGQFVSGLICNGQVLYLNSEYYIQKDKTIICYLCVPLKDSLNKKYFNDDCKKSYSKLINKLEKPISQTIIGEEISKRNFCTCKEVPFYILESTHLGPVKCGKCLNLTALYQLPKLKFEKDYYSLRIWNSDYQTYSNLWLSSGVGEKMAYNQISNPRSTLNQKALKICKEYSMLTNKVFYYDLNEIEKKHKTTCPICKRKWKQEILFLDEYEYKCEYCKLLSNDSGYIRNED